MVTIPTGSDNGENTEEEGIRIPHDFSMFFYRTVGSRKKERGRD